MFSIYERRTEPFIIGVLGLHFSLSILAIVTRKNNTIQTILWLCLRMVFSAFSCCTNRQVLTRFACAVLAAWLAKYLNMLGGKYWMQFATQDYFDKNGFFVSMMYSLPLMFICLFIVVST